MCSSPNLSSNFVKSGFLIIFALVFCNAFGQKTAMKPSASDGLSNSMSSLTAALDSFNLKLPSEKLFVHTDRPAYAIGDTLWFKSYIFNGNNLSYTNKSGLLYLELINDSAIVVKRISVPVVIGLCWGQITLPDDTFSEGVYTLRAYTNWMQNFGPESFYKQRIYLSKAEGSHWVVSQLSDVKTEGGKKTLNFSAQFKNADGKPLGYKSIQWKIYDGKKVLAKDAYETVKDRLEANITLPENLNGPLYFVAEEKGGEKQKVSFPISFNQPEALDLQFMPESGYIIAGLPTRLGFKALGADGLGKDIEGFIKDATGAEIVAFASSHKGMGEVTITPEPNQVYSAHVKLKDGTQKVFPLPTVKASGSLLQVINNPKSDSLRIYILLSENLVNNQSYKLAGMSNGQIRYAATITANRQRISGKVAKSLFASGVAHFTLFNDKNEPLNERITFIHHKNALNIKISASKPSYVARDSVPLSLQVQSAEGKPVVGSLSLSVTDDSQVKINAQQNNILSQIFLSSDIKGNIEDPAWYLNGSEEAGSAVDLLMLTQGWVGYKWNDIFDPAMKPVFVAEPEYKVSGKVLNVFNKPVANSKLLLLSNGKYKVFKDTISNKDGRFIFRNLPPVDTASFFVQARNARGKSFNVGLELDVFKPAAATKFKYPITTPWFVNIDSAYFQLVRNREKIKSELLKEGKYVLKEVVVTAKKPVRNSKNLNGPGEADQVLNEKDALNAGNINLAQLLEKQIKGFNVRFKGTERYFYLNEKKVRFVIDGLAIDRMYFAGDPPIPNEYYNFVNDALIGINAGDVLGVEVMYNMRYTSKYGADNLTIQEQLNSSNDIAFIEITTRSGNGYMAKTTPGIAVYRPLPLTWPKNFYNPKYIAPVPTKFSDFRPTIYWNPNILSNQQGEAKTSFYTSDKTGTYTVIVQGSDMGGGLGFSSFKINVNAKK